jgi:hypothetical protein
LVQFAIYLLLVFPFEISAKCQHNVASWFSAHTTLLNKYKTDTRMGGAPDRVLTLQRSQMHPPKKYLYLTPDTTCECEWGCKAPNNLLVALNRKYSVVPVHTHPTAWRNYYRYIKGHLIQMISFFFWKF